MRSRAILYHVQPISFKVEIIPAYLLISYI